MGLFDGASATEEEGSTAEMAKWLEAPVLLVLDAAGMARTIAAVAAGLRRLRSGPDAGRRDRQPGRQPRPPAAAAAGPARARRCWARFPVAAEHAFPQPPPGPAHRRPRHRARGPARRLGRPRRPSGGTWTRCWRSPARAARSGLAQAPPVDPEPKPGPLPLRIAAGSAALPDRHRPGRCVSFLLRRQPAPPRRRLGAELVRFSPLRDARLPDVDGLYLGGGYPEVHAAALAANRTHARRHRRLRPPGPSGLRRMRRSHVSCAVHRDHRRNRRIPWSACCPGRPSYPPGSRRSATSRSSSQQRCILGPPGLRFRGHQFRYSRLEGTEGADLAYSRAPPPRRRGHAPRAIARATCSAATCTPTGPPTRWSPSTW